MPAGAAASRTKTCGSSGVGWLVSREKKLAWVTNWSLSGSAASSDWAYSEVARRALMSAETHRVIRCRSMVDLPFVVFYPHRPRHHLVDLRVVHDPGPRIPAPLHCREERLRPRATRRQRHELVRVTGRRVRRRRIAPGIGAVPGGGEDALAARRAEPEVT